jgi:hypothetical protein
MEEELLFRTQTNTERDRETPTVRGGLQGTWKSQDGALKRFNVGKKRGGSKDNNEMLTRGGLGASRGEYLDI